jgi:hypothetical protein
LTFRKRSDSLGNRAAASSASVQESRSNARSILSARAAGKISAAARSRPSGTRARRRASYPNASPERRLKIGWKTTKRPFERSTSSSQSARTWSPAAGSGARFPIASHFVCAGSSGATRTFSARGPRLDSRWESRLSTPRSIKKRRARP